MDKTRRSRRRQACVRCRDQKVRCDLGENDSQQCSKCRQAKEDCVQPPVHPRYADRNKTKKVSHIPLKPAIEAATTATTTTATTPASVRSLNQQVSTPIPDVARVSVRNVVPLDDPTARDLNGLFIEGKVIGELFQIFFAQFAAMIPILDPAMSPDQYFDRSPLLFWCVIAVAIRKSSLSRDLIYELTKRTMTMAMSSLNIAAVHVVESLLILLSWWLLTATTIIEVPSVAAGSLLHLAMHIGLHNPIRSQDYVRKRISLSKDEIGHRALLWAHTVILYQQYWSTVGTPCDAFNDFGSDAESVIGPLHDSLRYRRSLSKVTAETLSLLRKESQNIENGLSSNIDALIKLGDGQLSRWKPEVRTFDELHWLISRLLIHSHHLHQPLSKPTDMTLSLYNLACSVLQCMQNLQNQMSTAGTTYVFQTSQIALFTLVLLTSIPSFAALVDVSEANSLISYILWQQEEFTLGVIGTDWRVRMVMLVHRLRSSLSAFRNEQGEATLELRIKTRGPMSIVHDTVWWARSELATMPRAYKGNQPGYMEAVVQESQSLPSIRAQSAAPALTSSVASFSPAINEGVLVTDATNSRSGVFENPAQFNLENLVFDEDLFLEMNWDFLYDME